MAIYRDGKLVEKKLIDTSKKEPRLVMPRRSKEWFAAEIDLERGESVTAGLPIEVDAIALGPTLQAVNPTLPPPDNLLEEISRIGEEIQGAAEFDDSDVELDSPDYRPSRTPPRVAIHENQVITHGVTHVELLSAPSEVLRYYVEMLFDPSVVIDWANKTQFPARYPVRRRALALELHCLLIQSDDILDQMTFWTCDGKEVVVEFIPPAIVEIKEVNVWSQPPAKKSRIIRL